MKRWCMFHAFDGSPPSWHSVEGLILWGHKASLCPFGSWQVIWHGIDGGSGGAPVSLVDQLDAVMCARRRSDNGAVADR